MLSPYFFDLDQQVCPLERVRTVPFYDEFLRQMTSAWDPSRAESAVLAGVPLFTKDLNCRCFDPNTTFVLNPQVWTDPAPGQWGTAAPYYSDYRTRRRPQENLV